jgi:putative Mg2+ transporter-C (MgtC) family protein
MSTTLEWPEIALRLLLTVIAGTVIGIDRSEHGRPAGLRTTLLVCLAASLSMIQAQLLLGTVGKRSDSFVTLDLMRLPLGILSGMGFIGGGTILKRGDIVVGVTTAATLWFVTMVGLCLGGGQLVLGMTAAVLGVMVLWCFRWFEALFPRDRRGSLVISSQLDGPSEEMIRRTLRDAGFEILAMGVDVQLAETRREIHCTLRWRERPRGDSHSPRFLDELSRRPGIFALHWRPQGDPMGSG